MPENRSKNGRFVKGNCGNPGGRPKMTQEQRDAKEMLKAACPAAAALLIDTMTNPEAKLELRTHCAEVVMDRVWGKAAQPIDGSLNAAITIDLGDAEELAK